jgi:hypoxanthine phosphoribosyltransferase
MNLAIGMEWIDNPQKGLNMSQNSYDYYNRKGIHPISWEDFHGICKALAEAVSRFEPEVILPIGRGGYYPGALLAHLLQIEVFPVRVSRRVKDIVKYNQPHWIMSLPAEVVSHRVLIVDEICDSGGTLLMVKEKAFALGASQVKSAVLYSHTKAASVPDYIGIITDELLLNPWDREMLRDGEFHFHPEYVEALRHQGVAVSPDLLIPATSIRLAKE